MGVPAMHTGSMMFISSLHLGWSVHQDDVRFGSSAHLAGSGELPWRLICIRMIKLPSDPSIRPAHTMQPWYRVLGMTQTTKPIWLTFNPTRSENTEDVPGPCLSRARSHFVHLQVTVPYLRSEYGKEFDFEAPVKLLDRLMHSMPSSRQQQVIVLGQVLAADVNIGYEDIVNTQVRSAGPALGSRFSNLGE